MWELAHKGKRGTAVLDNGLNPKPLTVPPEASMFLETQRFGLQSVARYLGVPPEMISSDSGNPKTYASLEMRNQDFLTFGVAGVTGSFSARQNPPGDRRGMDR